MKLKKQEQGSESFSFHKILAPWLRNTSSLQVSPTLASGMEFELAGKVNEIQGSVIKEEPGAFWSPQG